MKLKRDEAFLNNVGRGVGTNLGTVQHRQMMMKIDQHFLDQSSGRMLDVDIVQFIQTADLSKMNSPDRVRVSLANLEYERNQSEMKKARLKRQRGVASMEKASCPICLDSYRPGASVVYPDCGHLACDDCMKKILEDRDLANACVTCRHEFEDHDDLTRMFFKFNYDGDVICRFCERPFRADSSNDDSCHVLQCGHAYHLGCLRYTELHCLACSRNIIGARDSKRLFLYFD